MSIRPAAPATSPTRRAAARQTAARQTAAPTVAPRRTAPARGGSSRTPAAEPALVDPALDEALERISDLAARLWAVRSAHRPVTVGWRRSSTRCAECGQPVPCATLLAAG